MGLLEISSTEVEHNLKRHSYEIPFQDNLIKGEVEFIFSDNVNRLITFSNCIFLDDVEIITSADSLTSFQFTAVEFRGKVNIKFNRGSELKGHFITAHNGLNISGHSTKLTITQSIFFGNVQFEGHFSNFTCKNITHKNSLIETEFKARFVIKGNADFSHSKLIGADFQNSEFHGEADFSNSAFLTGNKYYSCLFNQCKFVKRASFHEVVFEKKVFLSGAIFLEEVKFSKVKNDAGESEFFGTKFYQRTSFDNSKWTLISFKECEFHDLASFKEANISYLTFSKALFLKATDFLGAEIDAGDREACRVIKNEFLKINNQVEALRFRAKEMIAYEKELKRNGRLGEFALVFLNKISNGHNLSWSRGVLFTLAVGIAFYTFYIFSLGTLPFNWGWKGWEYFWGASGTNIKYFIRFFIVTHDIDFMEKYQPSALSFIIDFVGKVFIGYGIYQTIQAFRKHGKI